MSDSIPRELAEALLLGPEPHAKLEVGATGANFPAELHLADVEPLGSLSQFRRSRSVFIAPTLEPAELTARFTEALQRAGFSSSPPPRSSGFSGGNTIEYPRHSRGDVSLAFSVITRPDGGSLLVAGVGPNIEKERERHMSHAGVRAMREASPLPLLHPPAGTRVWETGAGSSGSSYVMRAALTPPLQVDAVADHYNAQLEALGWKPVGRSLFPSAGFVCYTFVDARRAYWAGLLGVSAKNEFNTMRLQLSVSNLESDD